MRGIKVIALVIFLSKVVKSPQRKMAVKVRVTISKVRGRNRMIRKDHPDRTGNVQISVRYSPLVLLRKTKSWFYTVFVLGRGMTA